ncbi:probable alpha-glucuronidase precursor [Rhynchosporium graminicola]|uniref:Alpha-glucuronidase n=1 Tax=Rhynchosporium graminicola TaxID=2792576 RepID=A0A1E1KM30_9HELO|nr:probable alpha-glucuronidase precursor [Rhynchosporium commune]
MANIESGLDAWLRYAPLPSDERNSFKHPENLICLSDSKTSPIHTAGKELQDGLNRILGSQVNVLPVSALKETASAFIIGTVESYTSAGGDIQNIPELKEDGFWLSNQGDTVEILGFNERGALYGTFEYLSKLAQGTLSTVAYATNPSAPIRWVNEWDNLDGSIERGYAGLSFFFRDGKVVQDLTRATQYARLLSSIRINGIVVNNVNSHCSLLNDENMSGLGRIADAMRPYGLRIGVALFFDSPKELGGLPTSDPLDPAVRQWWNDITTKLYKHVPDLLGYTIKANSEGQPGPLTYGRSLADGANMFARALKPHGDGLVMYRAFVYNHHLDESNMKNDRANAAVEFFKHLDAEFDDNVIVQIKFGPIDFQVREPVSPLLANLRKTKAVIEFQVCQEYMGQQSHVVYMAPLWKTILDFDLRIDGKPSVVRNILTGERLGWDRTGYTAVVNVGSDNTWLGNHMAMSNLYAYGRMCWNPQDDPEDIVRDWTRLTFGLDKTVVDTISNILMATWPAYEGYSGNLGIQTLCDIIHIHYGPGPGSHDGNGWGQWTRADSKALGMDRTVATGTGFAGQYPPEVAAMYEHIETTPDELLLWFHHLPYSHRLKSGKTVIQHFYDEHYDGSATAQTFPTQWESLRGLVDDHRHKQLELNFKYQAGHSLVWRDAINGFYFEKCGIPDELGRVGNYKYRIEAESMELDGYKIVDVTPAEMASAGKAVITATDNAPGTVKTKLEYPSGTYDVAVNYFDVIGGRSQFRIFINERQIGEWVGDLEDKLMHCFSKLLDGHSATRITFPGVKIEKGDLLKIVGVPDGIEHAPLDYISILPEGIVD